MEYKKFESDPQKQRLHFVGSVVPAGSAAGNPAISAAGNICQLGVIDGLARQSALEVVQVVSYYPNRAFPKGDLVYFGGLKGSICREVPFVAVPYLNLPGLRVVIANLAIFLRLLRTVRSGDTVLFYNLAIPSGFVGMMLRAFRKFRFCAMIYDLNVPGQTVPDSLRWRLEFKKHELIIPRLDKVIAITQKIITDFKVGDKGIVVEGGVRSIAEVPADPLTDAGAPFTMVFAGALTEYNGVAVILAAFASLEGARFRLVIAGDGPLRKTVEQAAATDSRVVYKGMIAHQEVGKVYESANLLLCVRLTQKLDTGYFFPSKLIEYLATGKPVLTTKVATTNMDLPSISYIADDESVEGIAAAMRKAREAGAAANAELGRRALTEIGAKMTWRSQAQKIRAFLFARQGSTAEQGFKNQ
ncbi:glycosyltransferase [Massilia varians]